MQKGKGKKGLRGNFGDKPLSEDTHVIKLLASLENKYSISNVYEVPHAYNIDKIVIMPVNNDTSFIYWELTDRLLNSKLRELNVDSANVSADLIIKIFEAGKDCRKEIYSFKTKEKIGKRYIKCHISFKSLVASAGILKGEEFVVLLKSKAISNPSSENTETEGEIWMKKTKDTHKIIKPPGSEIKSDITHIIKETKLQKYYKETMESNKTPSSSITGLKSPSSRA